ncbi:hypothetical protein Tco_1216189 [Tanacetum coccineum]
MRALFKETLDEVASNTYLTRSQFGNFCSTICSEYFRQRQILDSRGAIPTMTAVDAKKSSKKWWNTLKNGIMETSLRRITVTSVGLAAITSYTKTNLGREIKKVNEKVYAAQVGWKIHPEQIHDCNQQKRHEANFQFDQEKSRITTDAAIRIHRSINLNFRNTNGTNEQGLQDKRYEDLDMELIDTYPSYCDVDKEKSIILEDMDAYRDDGTGAIYVG